MKAVLILALIGQCYARQGVVQQSYVANTYAAPTYNQVYAVPYVEKVKFVAVEAQPSYDYYAALAASASRNYERFQEYAAQAPQPAITYSIPSPQPVYQAPAPAKSAPDPVQATPQRQAYGTPQQPVYGTSQQPTYDAPAPAKAPPLPLQAPGAPEKNSYPDNGTPPPVIRKSPMNYSATMGGEYDVPPPPAPRVPTAFNDSQKTIHSVNTGFLNVLNKNCASCHTGRSSKGDFPIFDYPGRLANLTESDLQNIYSQVDRGKMPFKRSMSVADRQALLGMLSGNISSSMANR